MRPTNARRWLAHCLRALANRLDPVRFVWEESHNYTDTAYDRTGTAYIKPSWYVDEG